MDAQQVFTVGQQGLMLMLMVAAPLLLTVLVVGLVVSVLQAATQINEATLVHPQLLAMRARSSSPAMMHVLLDYMRLLFEACRS
jgi:flagellar biosynthetic protein FliQ